MDIVQATWQALEPKGYPLACPISCVTSAINKKAALGAVISLIAVISSSFAKALGLKMK